MQPAAVSLKVLTVQTYAETPLPSVSQMQDHLGLQGVLMYPVIEGLGSRQARQQWLWLVLNSVPSHSPLQWLNVWSLVLGPPWKWQVGKMMSEVPTVSSEVGTVLILLSALSSVTPFVCLAHYRSLFNTCCLSE